MKTSRIMNVKAWVRSGEPWVWMNAAAVSASILLVTGLLALIFVRGMGHFWPTEVHEIVYQDENGQHSSLTGQVRTREKVSAERLIESGIEVPAGTRMIERILIKTGNRDLTGEDFRWILEPQILQDNKPLSMVVLEREEWGTFYGRVVGLKREGQIVQSRDVWTDFQGMIQHAAGLRKQIRERQLIALEEEIQRDSVILIVSGGQEIELPMATIIDAWKPNSMTGIERMGHYFRKFWSFLADEPREANTEGGIYPAIFGTILMVLLMTVVVTPFGVIAGVYLKEYARQGFLTRTIRIAVNNLAGVPSIVYGVFGLGFFVYTLGGGIDKLFFEATLPAPTFGTGNLFWASLTLALLTLPVVIVSTEEGLARIPRSLREGSLALGATQWETLWRTIIPMASPGILTGMILAVARAAGEVAPLMLLGVVKLAPSLPIDGNAPFLHLDRKFMHLGFHIYDVGFQSPNVEAARPLVYATAFLLVTVILLLNLTAIHVRNGLREKYRGLET